MEERITNYVAFGRIGEEFAGKMLEQKGWRILEMNYRCRRGEVDIIARRGNEISFVEVKTRQSTRYGRPGEAVNRTKQRRLKGAAEYYMIKYKDPSIVVSFQVVEILVNHIENAF